jgi:uroporphyrinogen-III decarboxylase
MTGRERMLAAYEGKAPDCVPAAAPYMFLSDADHWTEATGLPVWKFYEWRYQDPETHVRAYADFKRAMPFDAFEPWPADSAEKRENISVVEKDGKHFLRDRRDDSLKPVPDSIHESARSGHANEEQRVFTREEAKAAVKVTPAARLLAEGRLDYAKAAFAVYGGSHFFVTGGVVSTFNSCSVYFGYTNTFAIVREEPGLFHYVSSLLLEKNMETIRACAAAGGDAVYIDDAGATSDMISVQDYEDFCFPYVREQVKEIKRLGKKAILIYFGGIADRADRILSLEPDALVMEASMSGYVNDLADVSKLADGKTCLYGNLNPYDDVELLSDQALEEKVKLQHAAGAVRNRFVTSTGSPLTPGTLSSRIRRLVEMSHSIRP